MSLHLGPEGAELSGRCGCERTENCKEIQGVEQFDQGRCFNTNISRDKMVIWLCNCLAFLY